MKKIIGIGIACMQFSTVVCAHPPQDIQISFDKKTKLLSAVIVHPVSNPASHYIGTVDIALNGKEIISQKISQQETNTHQSLAYFISDVKPGDVVSVEGYCNMSGTLTKQITIQ